MKLMEGDFNIGDLRPPSLCCSADSTVMDGVATAISVPFGLFRESREMNFSAIFRQVLPLTIGTKIGVF